MPLRAGVTTATGSSSALAASGRAAPTPSAARWVAHLPRRPAVLSTFSPSSLCRLRHCGSPSSALVARASHDNVRHQPNRTVRITRAPRRTPASSSSQTSRLPAPHHPYTQPVPVPVPVPADGLASRHGGSHHHHHHGASPSQALVPNPSSSADATADGNGVGSGLDAGRDQLLPSLPRWAAWDALPSRYKLILGTALSFVICNLDKVNLSVCIIPMARDYGWSPTTVGLVQSAFFWGYMLCQLPGGYLNSRLGGRRILPAGVLLYSAATGVVPAVAASVPALCLSRAVVGFGQATAPSAATDIVARSVPPGERARAVTFIFSGFHVGSILGLLAAPALIAHTGWRSVFLAFGALGLLWWGWFEQAVMGSITASEPDFASRLIADSRTLAPASSSPTSLTSPSPTSAAAAAPPSPPPLPWRAFLRSVPVRALAYTHFANNWFHYTMLAWLPTYFVDTLSVDLLHASQTALLPPLAGIAAGAAAGAGADALISRGVPVPAVRKLVQNTAFVVPTVLLLAACTPAVSDSPGATTAAITAALGISSGSLAGLFCTHQDMSPKYAPILLGLTNTTAAIPGVLGVASVGYLFETTQSWEVALFLPSAFFMVTAAAAYTVWGRNEPIDFDAADNSPFGWEEPLQAARSTLAAWGESARGAAARWGLGPHDGAANRDADASAAAAEEDGDVDGGREGRAAGDGDGWESRAQRGPAAAGLGRVIRRLRGILAGRE